MNARNDEPWWAMRPDPHIGERISFIDARGVSWQVTERECAGAPGGRGRHCLVFDSGEVLRRVWQYPEHWRTLSDLALAELSWRR